jgi:hypothetical protein
VADCVQRFAPDFTVHLGDVYFVGGETEIRENFLGEKTSPYDPVKWPMGKLGSFALSGNHEMYARGRGYYNDILPRMGLKAPGSEWGSGQGAGFFCLEDKRGLILLTHHGCYSAFSDWYRVPAKQLAGIIRRPVLWFWGHEHKLAIYDKYAVAGGIEAYGRCIGHGGMPVERGAEPDLECPWLAWDNRRYENGEKVNVGYNGYANFSLDGPSLRVEYRDLHCTLLFTEDWRVDLSSGALEGPHLQKVLQDPSLHMRER